MKRLSRRLLQKSQEAFTLSLEIFNKPTINYRTEGFCFFFINAWELMMKAKIIENSKKEESIFYKAKHDEPKRSITFNDALKRVFNNERDPVRRNLERIDELRNCATHLIIPEIEAIFVGLFQAGVLNYTHKIYEWFGRSITELISPALLSLVFDVNHFDPIVVSKRHGKDVLEFIQRLKSGIDSEEQDIGNATEYNIPISYRLVLSKNPSEADIHLTSGSSSIDGVNGVIIEVPKDPDRTHPYLQKDIVATLKERFGTGTRFTSYDFQCILWKEKIKRQNSHYYYHIVKPEVHKYSDALVEFIVDRVTQNANYLSDLRNAYRNRQRPVDIA